MLSAQGRTVAEIVRPVGCHRADLFPLAQGVGGLKIDQPRRLKELEQENARLRKALSDSIIDNQILREVSKGKLLSPARRRQVVAHGRHRLRHSERRICRALHVTRYASQPRDDEAPLTAAIIELAGQYGRYGYRRVHALLGTKGWSISRARVEWKREGPASELRQIDGCQVKN